MLIKLETNVGDTLWVDAFDIHIIAPRTAGDQGHEIPVLGESVIFGPGLPRTVVRSSPDSLAQRVNRARRLAQLGKAGAEEEEVSRVRM